MRLERGKTTKRAKHKKRPTEAGRKATLAEDLLAVRRANRLHLRCAQSDSVRPDYANRRAVNQRAGNWSAAENKCRRGAFGYRGAKGPIPEPQQRVSGNLGYCAKRRDFRRIVAAKALTSRQRQFAGKFLASHTGGVRVDSAETPRWVQMVVYGRIGRALSGMSSRTVRCLKM
jgi:hypothetical protein